MTIFIYDVNHTVLSAGLSFVISTNFPDAKVIRNGLMDQPLNEKVDLLILFQEPGVPVDTMQWRKVKEWCGNPSCLALLDKPNFKQLKSLLCAFPVRMIATTHEVNDELIKDILNIQSDSVIFYSNTIKNTVHEFMCKNDEDDEANLHLTRREIQVLELVREGRTASEIAQEMNLSVNTVQVFLSKLRKKFKVRNTLSLVHRKS